MHTRANGRLKCTTTPTFDQPPAKHRVLTKHLKVYNANRPHQNQYCELGFDIY